MKKKPPLLFVSAPQEEEEATYIKWLKGHELKMKEQEMMDMDALRRYWTDPRLHPDEAFLRDYMLNEGWKDKGAGRWVGTVGVACKWNYGYIVSILIML